MRFSDIYRWQKTSHSQLRVQFRCFTGFPFTPIDGAPLRVGVAHTPDGGKVEVGILSTEKYLRPVYPLLPSVTYQLRIVMIFNRIAKTEVADKLPGVGHI